MSQYDPRNDPRACDLSRGDIQCSWILPMNDGHLCCALKAHHAGEHRTGYLENSSHAEEFWMDGQAEHEPERKEGRQL